MVEIAVGEDESWRVLQVELNQVWMGVRSCCKKTRICHQIISIYDKDRIRASPGWQIQSPSQLVNHKARDRVLDVGLRQYVPGIVQEISAGLQPNQH